MVIDGNTILCGLFGHPVAHSFSPAMHNAAFNALKMNWVYLPFNVEPQHLQQAVAAIKSLHLAGVNVTIPHKEAVISLLDELTPAAQNIGAVNTIVNQNGRLLGHNTDGAGFTKALVAEFQFAAAGKSVVILGAGGAAKAVAVQLALEGVKNITIVNRALSKAEAIASNLSKFPVNVQLLTWDQQEILARKMSNADLIVQTTNIGMHPHVDQCVPVPKGVLHSNQVVCDLIYNPVETVFLKQAMMAGAKATNGLGMLLYQGAMAFEAWTGATAPVNVMRQVLLNKLGDY
ncbi:shikimate dehydrogenase [Peptococcaceae bacterium 1198_IL3148]